MLGDSGHKEKGWSVLRTPQLNLLHYSQSKNCQGAADGGFLGTGTWYKRGPEQSVLQCS